MNCQGNANAGSNSTTYNSDNRGRAQAPSGSTAASGTANSSDTSACINRRSCRGTASTWWKAEVQDTAGFLV